MTKAQNILIDGEVVCGELSWTSHVLEHASDARCQVDDLVRPALVEYLASGMVVSDNNREVERSQQYCLQSVQRG